jgi:UPF0755 protein
MKRISFLIVMLLLIWGGIAVWWNGSTAPVNTNDTTQKTFTVQKGENVREIANNLKAQGFIKSPVAFFLLIKEKNLDGKIQAGEFHLSPAMSADEVLQALQRGSYDAVITIPEGKRAEEIADTLQINLSTYQDSWRQRLAANEGYLFPDTYAFPKDADIETIITTMRGNFDKKFATIPPGTYSTLYSQSQLVTIASLVEREARFDEDRPLVASVIFNRLKINMPLQIDATIQYALGYQADKKNWWKQDLTIDDIHLNSLYNTYQNTGLPPTPISNPGINVLKAVVNAPTTDYVYYITDPKTGRNVYAKTLDEHNANIKKYGL